MRTHKKRRILPILLVLTMVSIIASPIATMAAEVTVNLGTASEFAVLAGTTVTNTGTTTIDGTLPAGGGNVGVFPGAAFTGQASVTMTGWNVYLADLAGVASQAKGDLTTAYLDAASRTPTTTFVATDNQLGGKTLTTGVYAFGHADTANITAANPLILDAEGNPDAVFIFQASSDLVTAANSEIRLINGARFCRVFWQVTSSATLGTGSKFVGHIFALTSITAQTNATIEGQLLARNGAVNLDSNTIMNGICAATPTTATLNVIKHVINDNGRTAVAADFSLNVKSGGVDVLGSPAIGKESPGTTYTLPAGNYVVSENTFGGYTQVISGDSDASGNITLVAGTTNTVTITNNDTATGGNSNPPTTATLNVIKHVINDDGGTAVASDFRLYVKSEGIDVSGSPAIGKESPGTTYTLPAGDYVVSENSVAGYTQSISGDGNSLGNIRLTAGSNNTITITNNDIPATVVVPVIPTTTAAVDTITTGGVTTTITGGTLPNTSEPWYNLLFAGFILMLVGIVAWSLRKRYE